MPTNGAGLRAKRRLAIVAWAGLACLVIAPVIVAAASPYQAFRSAVYILASLAGVSALALLLVQPLLAAGYMPGLTQAQSRRGHLWVGSLFAVCVAIHIGGLYITSPQDATDALLFVAPTLFSIYGVVGMWAVIITILLVIFRTRMRLRYSAWNIIHNFVAALIVITSVVHALMIEGTMGSLSKWILCLAILATTTIAFIHVRFLKPKAAFNLAARNHRSSR